MRLPARGALSRILAAALPLGAALVAGCSSDPETPTDPSELAPPAAGKGFQLVTEEIVVPAGTEEQDCYFFKVSELAAANGLPADQPVNLHRIEAAQRAGSHHMNIFRVKTIVNLDPAKGRVQPAQNGVGECFKSPNWADWPLVANSQRDGKIDWTYPEGVANTFQPDEWLMLQTHYVNASTQKTPRDVGRVRVNFWTIPAAEVTYQLGTLFATKQSIRICKGNPTPEFGGGCQINSKEPVHVIGANGHFHSRGKKFEMLAWDGKEKTTPDASNLFYTSTDWDEPPMKKSPELDLVVQPGGGVWYTCSYEWALPEPSVGCDGLNKFDREKYSTPESALDCCYTFGPIVEKNEHCNAFLYYWPKTDDVACF
jgi:hypothetical protein